MHSGGAQVMLHDPSFTDKNVTQSSNLLNSHVTINFRDFIDIYEYLDDACEMFTRKFTNDDKDKTPVTDRNFLEQLLNCRNQYPKNLISGHLNINGLRNKFFEVNDIIMENLLDIFFISETKLDRSFPNAQFQVPDFKHYRVGRNAHGGGIAAYIRSDLPHRRRPDLESMATAPVEAFIIEIIIRNEFFLFVCIARTPNIKWLAVAVLMQL